MRKRFEKIYENNDWVHGSGEGSLIIHTRRYIDFLQRFFREHQIRSVVDLGCGDWQFSRHIDWNGIRYQGFDLVRSVIATNQSLYTSENISFHLHDGNHDNLPEADLLIVKDVLQHWSAQSIRAFLPTLSKFRMCLITNCINPLGLTENGDIADGDFRPLDLRLPPFNLPADEVFAFSQQRPFWLAPFKSPDWTKRVLLFSSEGLGRQDGNTPTV